MDEVCVFRPIGQVDAFSGVAFVVVKFPGPHAAIGQMRPLHVAMPIRTDRPAHVLSETRELAERCLRGKCVRSRQN